MSLKITPEFESAVDLLENGDEHVFLTGKAGTGKSTLLNYFRDTTQKKIAVLAPTGVAAVNVRGQTVHSFFGFRPDVTVKEAKRLAGRMLREDGAELRSATLDAALAGMPFVAVYRMQALSYLVARVLVSVDHIALPNLIAGDRIVPELVQRSFTPRAVASVLAGLLDDPLRAAAARSRLLGVKDTLCGDGAFDRAASAVLDEARQVCSNRGRA